MGALTAAVNKTGKDVVPSVITMMEELIHRGKDAHGIATPNSVTTAKSMRKLANENCCSSVAVGHNLSRILNRDQPQPVGGQEFKVVFEGRLFPFREAPELTEIMRKLDPNPIKNASCIIERLEGSYTFAVLASHKIVVGRDFFGTAPLYYGENDEICAVASERKALWKIDISQALPFPPGHLAVINSEGFSFKQAKVLRKPHRENVDMEAAVRALHLLILEAIRKRVSDIEKVALAFSGGVDSSVIAVLAKSIGMNVQLITVGLEDQPEVKFAEEAAEALELPLHIQTYTANYLEETFAKVLWLIEEAHTVKASIAVPFFWTAETASKLGYPILLAGQGADELYGGYQRYLAEYRRSGAKAVESAMYNDVENSYQTNFQRDNQVCSFHNVELRLPFMDQDVVDFSLRLPLRLKINSAYDQFRKRVLRQLARNLEIPTFIANKTKKAIQYTTGVNRAIQRLAKAEDLTLREYVEKVYKKAYKNAE